MTDQVIVKDDGADPHHADEPAGEEERADGRDVRRDGGGDRDRERPRRSAAS